MANPTETYPSEGQEKPVNYHAVVWDCVSTYFSGDRREHLHDVCVRKAREYDVDPVRLYYAVGEEVLDYYD